jgi:site-specific recombinase XerD
MKNDLVKLETQYIKLLEKSGKSINTIKNYKNDLTCFKDFLIEEKLNDFKNFNTTHSNNFAHYLIKRYPKENSRRRRLQTIRKFFDYLVDQNVITTNIIKSIVPAAKKVELPRPPTFQELMKIRHAEENNLKRTQSPLEELTILRNILIFDLIYLAGLKVSDLHHLKNDQVFINDKNKSSRILRHTSKRDPASIPMPDSITPLYQKYSKLRDELSAKNDLEFDDVLFNANPFRILAGGLSPRGIELVFKIWATTYKTEITARNLRQAAIFRWLSLKKSAASIREWLGVTSFYDLKDYESLIKENPKRYTYVDLKTNHYE